MRCIRDEEAATYRSCAFVGNFAALALGTHSGEVRLHDTLSGDLIDTLDAHESPVYQLRVSTALLTCGHPTPSFRIHPPSPNPPAVYIQKAHCLWAFLKRLLDASLGYGRFHPLSCALTGV